MAAPIAAPAPKRAPRKPKNMAPRLTVESCMSGEHNRLLLAAGFTQALAWTGRMFDPFSPESDASVTVVCKRANAMHHALGSFQADAEYLLDCGEALEKAGYGWTIGYATNTPLICVSREPNVQVQA